jgi:hypothetical protein
LSSLDHLDLETNVGVFTAMRRFYANRDEKQLKTFFLSWRAISKASCMGKLKKWSRERCFYTWRLVKSAVQEDVLRRSFLFHMYTIANVSIPFMEFVRDTDIVVTRTTPFGRTFSEKSTQKQMDRASAYLENITGDFSNVMCVIASCSRMVGCTLGTVLVGLEGCLGTMQGGTYKLACGRIRGETVTDFKKWSKHAKDRQGKKYSFTDMSSPWSSLEKTWIISKLRGLAFMERRMTRHFGELMSITRALTGVSNAVDNDIQSLGTLGVKIKAVPKKHRHVFCVQTFIMTVYSHNNNNNNNNTSLLPLSSRMDAALGAADPREKYVKGPHLGGGTPDHHPLRRCFIVAPRPHWECMRAWQVTYGILSDVLCVPIPSLPPAQRIVVGIHAKWFFLQRPFEDQVIRSTDDPTVAIKLSDSCVLSGDDVVKTGMLNGLGKSPGNRARLLSSARFRRFLGTLSSLSNDVSRGLHGVPMGSQINQLIELGISVWVAYIVAYKELERGTWSWLLNENYPKKMNFSDKMFGVQIEKCTECRCSRVSWTKCGVVMEKGGEGGRKCGYCYTRGKTPK